MFSIKSSKFSDCLKCKLLEAPSCILETNNEDDLTKIDVIIVAECPAKQEIKEEKPLVGRSGKTFRKYFDKYIKNNCKYLITNVVLCEDTDENGNVANPDNDTINNCKGNLLALIDICKPKLIFTMGASPLKAFDFNKVKITGIRGEIIKYKNYNILPTFHPSFVNRNKHRPIIEENFKSDFIKCCEILEIIKCKKNINNNNNIKKGITFYNIPDKYYTDEYRLVDIQYSNKKNMVLYIFRDKNNKKEYYWTDDNYYCYQSNKNNNRLIVPYSELNQLNIKYKERNKLESDILYEGDISIDNKHAIDYFIKNKKECGDTNLNIYYFDIELDTDESKEFPNVKEAKYKICILTSIFNNETTTYVLDNGTNIENKDGIKIKIFKSEIELLKTFISDLHSKSPDIISGWSILNFDLPYIYNRLKKLNIEQSIMSPFEDVFIDGDKDYANIVGYVIVDMYEIYKNFQLIKRENYKLGTIAQIELNETKLQFEDSFATIYKRNINKYIDYNIVDTQLLERIEGKTKYIRLLNELRKICSGTFRGCRKTFGRLDNLIIKYLKERNLASKNTIDKNKEEFPGAYVKEPNIGLHNWIVDFDFTSLYPSLIITYNIGINTFIMKFEDEDIGYDFVYNFKDVPEEVSIILDPLFKNKRVKCNKNKLLSDVKNRNLIYTINGCFYKSHSEELSFYSDVLNNLLTSRKLYKRKMLESKQNKNFEASEFYDIRQKTFKILANALYGVLGNNMFRFFNIDLASSVTLSGQEAIKTSIINADKLMNNIHNNKNDDVINEIVPKNYIYNSNMDINTPYIITGDTDSLFLTMEKVISSDKNKDIAFKQINNYCNIISNYLNDKIIIDMIKKHNVSEKFNKLNLKNELICNRGLFISKKHYAIHVEFQEGKKIDEIVMMGLETKRRDFSNLTKEKLLELINIILKSDKISIKDIVEFVKEQEIEFLDKFKSGDISVAKPVSFTKKLEEYKAYKKGNKLPENIESMINWNNLVYDNFVVGSMGYLFKISGIDFNRAPKEVILNYNKYFLDKGKKLTSIALPVDEIRLPDYFIIDIKESLRYAWRDRYKQLLEPIIKLDKNILFR